MRLKVASVVMLLVGAGCRHLPAPDTGRSMFTVIEPPAAPPKAAPAEPREPTNHAQYREAYLLGNAALPVYPPRALKAKAGRATVGVHIIVDVTGRVSSISSSMYVFSTPGPYSDDFRNAVEAALHQWKFTPARVEDIETVTENGFTYNRVKKSESLETEFDLSFTFTVDGRVERGKQPRG